MDNKTLTARVLRRAAQLGAQKAARKCRVRSAATMAISFVAVLCFAAQMPAWMQNIDTSGYKNNSAVASMLSSAESLGYMVVGVLAFLLGAFVTLACYQAQKSTAKQEAKDEKAILDYLAAVQREDVEKKAQAAIKEPHQDEPT